MIGLVDAKLLTMTSNCPTCSVLIEKVAGVPASSINLAGTWRSDCFHITAVPENAPLGVKAACVICFVLGVKFVATRQDDGLCFDVEIRNRDNPLEKIREALFGAGFGEMQVSRYWSYSPGFVTWSIQLVAQNL